MPTRRRIATSSLLVLILAMLFVGVGPVSAGSPVTDDGLVLIGSDRAQAHLRGAAWDDNGNVLTGCIWDVLVSIVIADRLLSIGDGAPNPHGDVDVFLHNDGGPDCPEAIGGYYGSGQITNAVSMTSLISASLEDNYNVRVNDEFEVCFTLDWTATGDVRPVGGPRDQLHEVSRQVPAEVVGTVTMYCDTWEPRTLDTAHDDDVEVDAHLARSMNVLIDLP